MKLTVSFLGTPLPLSLSFPPSGGGSRGFNLKSLTSIGGLGGLCGLCGFGLSGSLDVKIDSPRVPSFLKSVSLLLC